MQLIHIVVQQKPTQRCKAILLQLKKKFKKRNSQEGEWETVWDGVGNWGEERVSKKRMNVSSVGAGSSRYGNCKTTADPREIHREILDPETRPQQAEKGLRGKEGKAVIVYSSF